MVVIRLSRGGSKHRPYYRIVIADARSPRDGKFIEVIGNYNPRTDPPTVEIDGERALYWLGAGAQPSAAVQRMLDKLGILAQAAAVRVASAPSAPLSLAPRPRSNILVPASCQLLLAARRTRRSLRHPARHQFSSAPSPGPTPPCPADGNASPENLTKQPTDRQVGVN